MGADAALPAPKRFLGELPDKSMLQP